MLHISEYFHPTAIFSVSAASYGTSASPLSPPTLA